MSITTEPVPMSTYARQRYELDTKLILNAAGARGGITSVLGMLDEGQITPDRAVELIRDSISDWEKRDRATRDATQGGEGR